MSIWSSDPFFDEDLSNPDFWTMKGALADATGTLMSWTTPLGYTFVLQGSGFAYKFGRPISGDAVILEIFGGNTLSATVTSIATPVTALFADGMARFFDAMFSDLSQSSRAA